MTDVFHAHARTHPSSPSVSATVDVLKQRAEDGATKHGITARIGHFGKSIDQGANPRVRILCVKRVTRVDAGLGEHAPHVQLRGRVFLPEMRLEGGELFGRSGGPDDVEAPRARLGEVARAAFEVLFLDVGVLAEREEDVERVIVIIGIAR
jgi:hypothetical protein